MITPIDTEGEAAAASFLATIGALQLLQLSSVTAGASHRTEILRGASQPESSARGLGGTFQVLGQQQRRCVRCQPAAWIQSVSNKSGSAFLQPRQQ
jgi:hypothetical protein